MGERIGQFELPFCNSFRPKIIQDQLCYTVDPNEYKNKIDLGNDLSLSLFINYNEDREFALEEYDTSGQDDFIIIETIGIKYFYLELNLLNICFLDLLKLKIGIEYNLNNVKEIKVTDEFLTLDKMTINCQNKESLQDCKTKKYIDASTEKCKCLPFTIVDDYQVISYISKCQLIRNFRRFV